MRPVGHTSIQELAQDFHELEDKCETLAVRDFQRVNADDLRHDYLWLRSEFFIKLAGLCGVTDTVTLSTIIDNTVMEFSL